MRRLPWACACSKAKARLESVLPPPVGTVSEKKPGGSAAWARHWRRMSARSVLTGVGATGNAAMCASNAWRICARVGKPSRRAGLPASKCASVSRKSASTRHENSMRTHRAKPPAPPGMHRRSGAKPSGFNTPSGGWAASDSCSSCRLSGSARRCARPLFQSPKPAWCPAIRYASTCAASLPGAPWVCSSRCMAHSAPAAEWVFSRPPTLPSMCASGLSACRTYF